MWLIESWMLFCWNGIKSCEICGCNVEAEWSLWLYPWMKFYSYKRTSGNMAISVYMKLSKIVDNHMVDKGYECGFECVDMWTC